VTARTFNGGWNDLEQRTQVRFIETVRAHLSLGADGIYAIYDASARSNGTSSQGQTVR
jgi:hypothetical protein